MERITITAKEAADYLGISYWSLLELAKKGEVPHIKVNRRVLFRKESLDSWVKDLESQSYVVHAERIEYGTLRQVH